MTEPKDGERLEFWQVSGTSDHTNVRHRIAIYHDYLSWSELAPKQADRKGAPVDHEWIIWSENDWQYKNGDHHHYWEWSRGGTDESFKLWLKRIDGVPRTDIFYEYEPARKRVEERLGSRLRQLEEDVRRTEAALYAVMFRDKVHDCLPLPVDTKESV